MAKKDYFIIFAALVALAVGAWYWQSRDYRVPIPEPKVAATAERLGAELLEKAQNPLKDELPQTNPFEQAETNPFIDVYENPFAQ